MIDSAVGQVLRAVRIRRRWRQEDVASRAKVSQSQVSLAERGHLEDITLRALRRIGRVLEVELPFDPRWRGPGLDRLLDAAHARLVELALAELSALAWEAMPEWSFNHFGERGAVDIVAWHPVHRAFLIIEVKSRLVDVQDLLSSMDRQARLASQLLPLERGWRPLIVGRLLVLPDASTHRDAVARHSATFSSSFPSRTREVRRWLRDPVGSLAGILFLRDSDSSDRPRGTDRVHAVRGDRPG